MTTDQRQTDDRIANQPTTEFLTRDSLAERSGGVWAYISVHRG